VRPDGRTNFAALCRELGVSRQVGYDLVARYRKARHDVSVAAERSRRPHMSPTKVALELEDFIVSARKQHPTWGPKKLRAWILHHHPPLPLPAPSTIGDILRRRGMTQGQLRKPRSKETARQPFANVTGPNATWCVDFKGHFATGDGRRCYPLTVIDAHSRFLIRCEGVLDPDGSEVMRIFDSAFQELGLPAAIRSDNGPPFASVGAGGLTKLSARHDHRGPTCGVSSAPSTPFAASTTTSDLTRRSDRERHRPPSRILRDAIRGRSSASTWHRGIDARPSTSADACRGTASSSSSSSELSPSVSSRKGLVVRNSLHRKDV
jgi:transposase InsO family protein